MNTSMRTGMATSMGTAIAIGTSLETDEARDLERNDAGEIISPVVISDCVGSTKSEIVERGQGEVEVEEEGGGEESKGKGTGQSVGGKHADQDAALLEESGSFVNSFCPIVASVSAMRKSCLFI